MTSANAEQPTAPTPRTETVPAHAGQPRAGLFTIEMDPPVLGAVSFVAAVGLTLQDGVILADPPVLGPGES